MDTLRLDRLLTLTQRRMGRSIVRRMTRLSLLPGQGKVLEHVYDHPGCTQGDICQAWEIDKATMSGVTGRMERDGLLLLQRDRQDKRITRLQLTEKGMELWLGLREQLAEVNERAFTGFSAQERRQLQELLKRVYDNLSEDGEGENE